MPNLNFEIEAVEIPRQAATPLLLFKLHIHEARAGTVPTPIHTIVLRCQVRIEPARRRYSAAEQQRLLDLFGTPERWGQTLRPMLWTQTSALVPPFTGSGEVDLPVPCSSDFCLAATKYFDALDEGDIPLCFLFSGTIFYRTEEEVLQAAQLAWDKEAYFRLKAGTWKELMELYYPHSAWLCLRKDVFDQLNQYRSRQGLPTWEQTVQRLLAAEETVKP